MRRHVASANEPLRTYQRRFYVRVLLPFATRSPHSHGGVPGRNILTNLDPHLGNRFAYTTDIASFYPSVHHTRVRRLFESWGWEAEAARAAARLCTRRHRLEQGLVSSPILADVLLGPVDRRIGAACSKAGLSYTRFVDDLTISGPFDLAASGFPALVVGILRENGFEVQPAKERAGRREDVTVTNLTFREGRADVRPEYAEELEQRIEQTKSLADGGPFAGPYHTPCQLWGRVGFVRSINPGRAKRLARRLRRIDWAAAEREALHRGLIVARKTLVRSDVGV